MFFMVMVMMVMVMILMVMMVMVMMVMVMMVMMRRRMQKHQLFRLASLEEDAKLRLDEAEQRFHAAAARGEQSKREGEEVAVL